MIDQLETVKLKILVILNFAWFDESLAGTQSTGTSGSTADRAGRERSTWRPGAWSACQTMVVMRLKRQYTEVFRRQIAAHG